MSFFQPSSTLKHNTFSGEGPVLEFYIGVSSNHAKTGSNSEVIAFFFFFDDYVTQSNTDKSGTLRFYETKKISNHVADEIQLKPGRYARG